MVDKPGPSHETPMLINIKKLWILKKHFKPINK